MSDEFAESLDICVAKDTQNEGTSSVLLAISKNNVYDGYIGKGYPTDLKRKFLAIRKKDSEEVRLANQLIHFFVLQSDTIYFRIKLYFFFQLKLVEVEECSLLSYHYNNCSKKKIDTPSEQSSMSTESARRILFKEFGGKKAMKSQDRKEKMKVNVDVVKDQLDKTLMGVWTIDALPMVYLVLICHSFSK